MLELNDRTVAIRKQSVRIEANGIVFIGVQPEWDKATRNQVTVKYRIAKYLVRKRAQRCFWRVCKQSHVVNPNIQPSPGENQPFIQRRKRPAIISSSDTDYASNSSSPKGITQPARDIHTTIPSPTAMTVVAMSSVRRENRQRSQGIEAIPPISSVPIHIGIRKPKPLVRTGRNKCGFQSVNPSLATAALDWAVLGRAA